MKQVCINQHHNRAKHRGVTVVLVMTLLLFSLSAFGRSNIIFGTQEWPGGTMKTEVASQILERIGYRVETVEGSSIPLAMAMRNGDIDIMLENWVPNMQHVVNDNLKSGEAEQLAVNIKDGLLGLAVPDYVRDAGVHSIADLNKFADKFEHNIYGIEGGNPDNGTVLDAIADNTYGLKDWSLVESSTPAMLGEVRRATKNGDWIVFIGWRPHWMNKEFDMHYLEDPDGMWDAKSTVVTFANTNFVDEHPNVAKFLRQYEQSSKLIDDWVYAYAFKKQEKEQVAKTWITNNHATVSRWLAGVKTSDGEHEAAELF